MFIYSPWQHWSHVFRQVVAQNWFIKYNLLSKVNKVKYFEVVYTYCIPICQNNYASRWCAKQNVYTEQIHFYIHIDRLAVKLTLLIAEDWQKRLVKVNDWTSIQHSKSLFIMTENIRRQDKLIKRILQRC